MTTSSLYPTHTIICKVPQPRSEFHTLSHKDQVTLRCSNASQRSAPIGRWVKNKQKKTDIEYPFELDEVIHYTLDGVSIHPVTTKIQASFLSQLPERKETAQEFHQEANGDVKTVTELL